MGFLLIPEVELRAAKRCMLPSNVKIPPGWRAWQGETSNLGGNWATFWDFGASIHHTKIRAFHTRNSVKEVVATVSQWAEFA